MSSCGHTADVTCAYCRPTEGASEGIMRDRLANYLHERQLQSEPLVIMLSDKVRDLEARIIDGALREASMLTRAEAAESRCSALEAALRHIAVVIGGEGTQFEEHLKATARHALVALASHAAKAKAETGGEGEGET